jgi:hypothetical protein
LARHKRLQHEGPKYVCGALDEHNAHGCGQPFARRDALKQHRRAWNGECEKKVFVRPDAPSVAPQIDEASNRKTREMTEGIVRENPTVITIAPLGFPFEC